MDKNYAFNEAIRQKLDHEHSVMSNRTGWHHAIQIAMFVALYTIVASHLPFHFLKTAIPILGILYALSAIYSLWISDKARACILMHWNRFLTRNNLKWEDFPPVSGNPLPHIEKSEKDQTIRDDMNITCIDILIAKYVPHCFMLYRFIPLIFIIIWVVCFIEIFNS